MNQKLTEPNNKIARIKSMAIFLKSSKKTNGLEKTVYNMDPHDILRIAREAESLPAEEIKEYSDIILEAATLAFRKSLECYIDLSSLIVKGEGTKELRRLSYSSIVAFYTDMISPRVYCPKDLLTDRPFYIGRVDQVLNARYTQALEDIKLLETALEEDTLEETAQRFTPQEIGNLLEIVERKSLRSEKSHKQYLAIAMAMTMCSQIQSEDKSIALTTEKPDA